ncbi:MAG: glutamate-5-semialdehyde dehydrogenase, partial [Clostridiales bacterium]|nr:glutamate-5-semialdehyde dehydrogenase [Clostridiales bacterium]
IGKNAKAASRLTMAMGTAEKNEILLKTAGALLENKAEILEANKTDVEKAKQAGNPGPLVDRLALNEARIEGMADGLIQVSKLPDPVGEVINMKTLPNGLVVGEKRVPMGVIGIIYEARPNVTSDAFGLCLKAGNAVILKGGSDAINSNKAIVDIFKKAISEMGINPNIVQLIEDTSRKTATELMRLNGYVDVLIPRGGAGLINSVVMNSTVPVIETGVGNCHIYVDDSADFDMALNILINAKTQRPGVCNAAESLLVSEKAASGFLPLAVKALKEKGVEVRGCEKTREICGDSEIIPATEEDYGREFLDMIISVKVVKDVDEAIAHIAKYSTGHSEAIITKDYDNAMKFSNEVDSAAVYVNASTRFTDGNEFGFGAEIGISTQKLHARGPMGLKALTTTKFIIFGNGQIRP